MWAGLNTWLEAVLPELQARAPELVRQHDHELTTILPALRRTMPNTRLSLTDLSSHQERVRNYAMDRAYRHGHGVIDLLVEWHALSGAGSWQLVCDDYDQASVLMRAFLRELVRRAAQRLQLELIVAVAPESPPAVLDDLPRAIPREFVHLDLPGSVERSDPQAAARAAEELEAAAGLNQLEMEIALPHLIRLWSQSGNTDRAIYWQALGMGLLNHYGFYEDAVRYVPAVCANIDRLIAHSAIFTRWSLVGSTLSCLIALGRANEALELVNREALDQIHEPRDKARVLYVLAMLHARFLPTKDLVLAEEFIERALAEVTTESIADANDRDFLRVFLSNGLAFIRHRQGRAEEAVALCDRGFEHLQVALPPTQHRLHRSVLMYNIAQVHASTGALEKALEAFAAAIEMDPNYSEYYNERGCVFMQLGRHDAAVRDFETAIRLSSPYAQVWTNLGQCYRQTGNLDAAVQAFSRALDLSPSLLLARVARADCLDQLGQAEPALADYDAALEQDGRQLAARVNRATLRFERGHVGAAIEDLDVAIAEFPGEAVLYKNRSAGHRALGHHELAERDLDTYRQLSGARA